MCKFKPFNKHLLVEKIPPKKNPNSSPVLLPEGIQTGTPERYGVVNFVCASSDCEQFLLNLNPEKPTYLCHDGSADDEFVDAAKDGEVSLVVDQSMVEEIKIEDEKFHVVHQNYVVGVVLE